MSETQTGLLSVLEHTVLVVKDNDKKMLPDLMALREMGKVVCGHDPSRKLYAFKLAEPSP